MARCSAFLAFLAVAFLVAPGHADEAALLKDAKSAFKRIKLPSASKLDKRVRSDVPGGIVIDSGPFDRLIASLMEPDAARLAAREDVLLRFAGSPSVKFGPVLKSAFGVLEQENADVYKRIAGVEKAYSEVFNKGYMESGETDRRTRKAAAILLPYYRTLLRRNATVTDLAGDALAGMREGDGRAWVLGAISDRSPAVRSAAALALGRIGGDDARVALHGAVSGDTDPGVRTSALLGLAHFKTADVKDAYIEALSDAAWQVRALAVEICVRTRLVEAAGPLIDALAKEGGRLRQDIDDALRALVGVRYYGDPELWKQWFTDNAEQVAARAKALAAEGAYDKPLGSIEDWPARGADAAAAAAKKDAKGATSAFYGIETLSKRILFIIDISRSMQDPAGSKPPAAGGKKDPFAGPKGNAKMDIARWQLHRAVAALPDDAAVNLVVYSESYKQWQAVMTPSKGGGRKKAHEFIDGLVANGVTNICDSLDKAFELAGDVPRGVNAPASPGGFAADTVFLLSDGNPNRGRITDLEALLTDVERRNRRARLVFHTIGIGEAAGGSFLEELAKRTGGDYVGFK